MEMEDHHGHQQYGMTTDLRQLVNGPRSTHFPSIPAAHPTAELFPGHRNLVAPHQNQQHYEMMMLMPRGVLHDFATPTDSATAAAASIPTPAASAPSLSGLEADTAAAAAACIGGDAFTGRWPRQETLTLLEIRSRLDPRFKEANQKGPLWDEVSRIMSEEHGYQRSGKKCREKFENLYKYYKKTKEGKAGRHDGKHYRFFRQLEALYGENRNPTAVPETNFVSTFHFQTSSHGHSSQTNQEMFHQSHNKHCDSLSLTNSTDFDTSSSDDDDNDHHSIEGNHDSTEKRRKRKNGRSWKVKIKDFIDSQMKKLVEKQEEWLDKLVRTLEEKEKERMLREDEWRKQEASRLEREKKFWARERAWIEARDAALMEALQNITGREMKAEAPDEGVVAAEILNQNEDGSEILNCSTVRGADSWPESEITRLQLLRNEMETRFPRSGCSEEVTWEEVATKMACFGYERTALMCKEKWESISNYPRDSKEGNKKRKENSRTTCFYFNNNDQSSMYNQGSTYCDINDQSQEIGKLQTNDGSSPSNSNVGNVAPGDTCFPFLMSEGGNLWENYGLKINKANQNH